MSIQKLLQKRAKHQELALARAIYLWKLYLGESKHHGGK